MNLKLLQEKYEDLYPKFVKYVIDTWIPKIDLWCKAWRLDATFQINNLIESYHNCLKSYYLGRNRGQNHCVDRLIHSLSQLVESDYKQEILQIFYSIKPIRLGEII